MMPLSLKPAAFLLAIGPAAWLLPAHAQIACDALHFHGQGSPGYRLYDLVLSGNTVTIAGETQMPEQFALGLAIADLGEGNAFYSYGYGEGILRAVDGTWENVFPDTLVRHNAAGNGASLYFQSNRTTSGTSANRIDRFDGTSSTVIWDDNSLYQSVADLAVDDDGRVYIFTGSAPFQTERLSILSPEGQVLAELPIAFNGANAYGCFLVDSTLYVGFGPSNPDFPDELVPISLTNGTAVMGEPIAMPTPVVGTTPNGPIYLQFTDLASCASSGIALSTEALMRPVAVPEIAYDPVQQALTVRSPLARNGQVHVLDALGRMVLSVRMQAAQTLDMAAWPAGVYVVSVVEAGERVAGKRIVKP